MFQSFKGLFNNPKNDILSSIVVFLVALPLCLGIALASNAPLFSGILAGIVGGVVVGLFSHSQLSVSGPAAGLVVIVIAAIQELGSFDAFLLAVVFCGIFQVILGYLKAGIIGLYFPSSVIKGMLAAIGLILILKQLPHLVGFDTDAFGEMEFVQKDGRNTFTFLTESLSHVTTGAAIVGLFSCAVILGWDKWLKSVKIVGQIPSGLVAVLAAVGLNQFWISTNSPFAISVEHLVSLPVLSEGEGILSLLTFPDFSQIGNYQVYITGATLAIVASLESLLSVEAIDKLDTLKRRTPQNEELKAQGIGNIVSGFIGGLPVTAVIVRSSANLAAGASSKLSAILHGLLLAGAVLIVPSIMNRIPLSALAAILILVGFKLTKPALYRYHWKLGAQQFVPFIVTVGAIIFSDLLIGICIGMATGVFFILKANYAVPYFYKEKMSCTDEKEIHLQLSEHVSFLNKASLQKSLDELPRGAKVVIDASKTQEFDYDALESVHLFKQKSHEKNLEVVFVNVPEFSMK